MQIPRNRIKPSPWNPRKISPAAKKKLKAKLKDVGLVETLVWNQRTGHLIGGHQRLAIIDELEKGTDYQLTVAAIDVDESQERELNVFLNNPSAQGEWDLPKLEELAKLPDVDPLRMGFDPLDVKLMFQDESLTPFAADSPVAEQVVQEMNQIADNQDAESALREQGATDEQIAEINKKRKAYREQAKKQDDAEFYLVVVFSDRAEVDGFLSRLGLPLDQRYLDGLQLAERVQ